MKNSKTLLAILLFVTFVFGVYKFWDVLMPFFTSALIAYILTPLVNLLCKRFKMKRGFSVLIVLVAFLVIFALIISFTLPSAINQISALVKDLSKYASNFDYYIQEGMDKLAKLNLPPQVTDMAQNLLAQSDGIISSLFNSVLSSLVSFSLGLFDVIVGVILTIYFLLDGKKLVDALLNALTPALRRHASALITFANILAMKYMRSRVLISAGMAVVIYIGLLIIGLEYAFLFAVLSFVLDFIPYFGSILAGAVEAFFALITCGWPTAIVVLVFVTIVQQIEGNVIIPKIQGEEAGIHPITVMFALLACNQIWGPLGMLISTPVAAVVKLVVVDIYKYIVSPSDDDDCSDRLMPE